MFLEKISPKHLGVLKGWIDESVKVARAFSEKPFQKRGITDSKKRKAILEEYT
ncbi:hypothetical protein [Tenacibaculum sp. Bg11-29]|uniref:hypothetical protein n=1 Tax=Tenacibaculum sp. Bg11-29 TaxID=2058306 RepID=UPI0012FEEB5A|nr:hypothetical protein [Tenacibaculum sp. Bg11-29]